MLLGWFLIHLRTLNIRTILYVYMSLYSMVEKYLVCILNVWLVVPSRLIYTVNICLLLATKATFLQTVKVNRYYEYTK